MFLLFTHVVHCSLHGLYESSKQTHAHTHIYTHNTYIVHTYIHIHTRARMDGTKANTTANVTHISDK